ncbi:MAG: glutamine synthetase family protein [Rhodovibrionaceae bacterium]|nr:glutamine synthetase family protein [Rhodovibrionaceae bacterium]
MPESDHSRPNAAESAAAVAAEAEAFLAAHPDSEALDAIFGDLSGVVRGKRYPIEQIDKVLQGLAFPGSSFLLDVMGESHDPGGMGFSDGDPDCVAVPVPGTLVPVPWLDRATAQVMLTFREADESGPYPFDPRNVLARALEPLTQMGLSPVVAFELEFYLIDRKRAEGNAPQPPISPTTGERDSGTQVYGMAEVDAFSNLLEDVNAACEAQGVPTNAISAEYAPGQFEINLQHVADPLRAADHCVMFKRAVKGVARKHGLQATFMAKPYPDEAGSGMHLHISLLDREGNNVFDGGNSASAMLRHAIGGILDCMDESMAFLAPNPNSFRRFAPNIFVPVRRSWGHENRSVALRIPLARGGAWRIEHRMAGADANPYLALATALAGVHHGIANKLDPGQAFEGNAGFAFDEDLPWRARRALDKLTKARVLPDYFGQRYLDVYAACKNAELDKFESRVSPAEYLFYLQPE